MEFPQIDAATCVILVTVILWAWTRLKLPLGCNYQEGCLRRQNQNAYWAFGSLIVLEILAGHFSFAWIPWIVGPSTGVIFYVFAVSSFQTGVGFWSKRRNRVLSLTPIVFCSMIATLMIKESVYVPMFGAFALGQIFHKKYVQMVYSSIQDLETLQAKVLKQEAFHANVRHFDSLSTQPTSQQA